MLAQKLTILDAQVSKRPCLLFRNRVKHHKGSVCSHEQSPRSVKSSEAQERCLWRRTALMCPLFVADVLGNVYPASAIDLPTSVSKGSYYVTLGLFVMTVPGLWSLIKRSAKSKIRRRTYSVPGPAEEDAMPLSDRAKQITRYFVNYNYQIKSMSDVISFVGNFQSSVGQASQLVLYTFFGLGSIALVLSVQFPEVGNYWYLLTVVSPLAGWYYWTRANREEEVKVKLVTSDDEKSTDIIVEGDEEELDRFGKELKLLEKGKVYIKGIMEQ